MTNIGLSRGPTTVPPATPVGSTTGSTKAGPYVHTQNLAMAVWTIPHNLKCFPPVTVVDDGNNKVEADVTYVDNNIIQVTHGIPLSGKAYIN